MIVCGWCHAETPTYACLACGRDPSLPWVQRGQLPPSVKEWDRVSARQRIEQIRRDNPGATIERIAELIGVSERTVRRQMSGE